jgi:hypothetical protein
MADIKHNVAVQVNKSSTASFTKGKANLNKPKEPIFKVRAARTIEPAVGAST